MLYFIYLFIFGLNSTRYLIVDSKDMNFTEFYVYLLV
jgi:hypothetical protein